VLCLPPPSGSPRPSATISAQGSVWGSSPRSRSSPGWRRATALPSRRRPTAGASRASICSSDVGGGSSPGWQAGSSGTRRWSHRRCARPRAARDAGLANHGRPWPWGGHRRRRHPWTAAGFRRGASPEAWSSASPCERLRTAGGHHRRRRRGSGLGRDDRGHRGPGSGPRGPRTRSPAVGVERGIGTSSDHSTRRQVDRAIKALASTLAPQAGSRQPP
jgi:hypothetical protein